MKQRTGTIRNLELEKLRIDLEKLLEADESEIIRDFCEQENSSDYEQCMLRAFRVMMCADPYSAEIAIDRCGQFLRDGYNLLTAIASKYAEETACQML